MFDSPPPNSPQLERGVLNTCLNHADAMILAATVLRDDHFFTPAHRDIWKAIVQVHRGGKAPDIVLVSETVPKRHVLLVADIAGDWTEFVDLEARFEKLIDLSRRRRLREIAATLTNSVAKEDASGSDLTAWLMQEAGAIVSATARPSERVSVVIDRVVVELMEIQEDGRDVFGIPTGFRRLDQLTGGWRGGSLIVVAARPGMGKSAMAGSFATVAAGQGTPTGIVSLEMTADDFAERMLGRAARVNMHGLRSRRGDAEDWDRLVETASGELRELPVYIETRAFRIEKVIPVIRRWYHLNAVRLAIVDYIQLMLTGGSDQVTELGNLSRSLKQLAMELDIPIIVLAQLNRNVENRSIQRPQLSDLRGSGRLEEDADVIVMLWRPEVYGHSSIDVYDPILGMTDTTSTEGMAEVLVEKNRRGPTGSFAVTFVREFASFEDSHALRTASVAAPV